jgi:hypothetical protein
MKNSHDITAHQGTSITHKFTFAAGGHRSVNLTGWNARLHIVDATSHKTKLECDIANGRLVVTNAEHGELSLKLKPEDTRPLKFDEGDTTLECVYELELTDPEGEVHSAVKAAFNLHRAFTR